MYKKDEVGGRYYAPTGDNTLFSSHGHHFRYTMSVVAVVIAVIVAFGVVYEVCRRKHVIRETMKPML